MAAQPHVLVTFGGHFGTGSDAEVWQCGVKLAGRASDGSAVGGNLRNLASYASSVQAGLATWFKSSAALMRNDFYLDWLKAANMGGGSSQNPYGKYAGLTDESGGPNPAVVNYAANSNPGAGTLTIQPAPQIITLSVTFRNKNAPRGPRITASHGRIYPPFKVVSSDDRFGDTSAYATAGINLLTTLAKPAVTMYVGPLLGDQTVDIRPALIGVDGTIRLIDRVEVGNVVDTVRNRKSKLREVYFGADFT